MSWVKRHNAEVFRKHVREALARRLSDQNYKCSIEERGCGSWYGKRIYSVDVEISYINATLTIRLGSVPAYWDYQNETVESACEKIIARLKSSCHKFSVERAGWNRESFSVDFLTSHILELLGDGDGEQ